MSEYIYYKQIRLLGLANCRVMGWLTV